MKAVLMSIRREHNANIESGKKVTELRTIPPSLEPPFRVYTYESGPDGRHKVVNEWICDLKMTWRMCMGIPAHLSKAACLPAKEILKYSDGGRKDVTELHISDLKIYDTPKELSEFWAYNAEWHKRFEDEEDFCCYDATNEYGELLNECSVFIENAGIENCYRCWEEWNGWCRRVKRPPQSWCYVEEIKL